MEKINNCGCGGEGKIIFALDKVVCGKCGTKTSIHKSVSRALTVWNRANPKQYSEEYVRKAFDWGLEIGFNMEADEYLKEWGTDFQEFLESPAKDNE